MQEGQTVGAARGREAALEAVLAVTGYAALTLVLMWPVVSAPTTKVYGLPSDPLSEVWRLDQFGKGEIGLVGDTVSKLANFPSGVPLRRAIDVTTVFYDLPSWALVQVVEPVFAYNILAFGGIWSAGIAAYLTLRLLGAGVLGSTLTGTLFTAAPIHLVEAHLHVGLSYVAPLPIVLLLGVRLLERPSLRRGALLGSVVACCGYLSAYLLLEALTISAGIAAAAGLNAARDRFRRRVTLEALAAAAGAGALILAPLLAVFVTHKGSVDASVSRPASDLTAFALHPGDYFDRPSSSYIGLIALLLAIGGLFLGRLSRAARYAIASAGIAGFLVSLGPGTSVFGSTPAMPSELIHEIIPYWRIFGRVEVVVALAVAVLAGLFVDRLSAMGRSRGALAAIAVAGLSVLDIAQKPPDPAANLGTPDPVAEWLEHGSGAVAEYPLYGFYHHGIGPYLFRQLRHGRPLLNGSVPETLSADLSAAAASLESSQIRAALTLAGVSEIVMDSTSKKPIGRAFTPMHVSAAHTIYRVNPTQGRAAVAVLRGAYNPEPAPDGSPFQWLGRQGEVRVVAAKVGPVAVVFDAVSIGVPRTVRIGSSHGRVVGTAPTSVELCVQALPGGRSLPVVTMPPPENLPHGDPRIASLGVFHLRARFGCNG
jgi:hypothetical protein